jgi:hypothetical protein
MIGVPFTREMFVNAQLQSAEHRDAMRRTRRGLALLNLKQLF